MVALVKVGFLGGLGGSGGSISPVVFNPRSTDLADPFGNVAEAISVANRTAVEWDGNLVAVPTAKHSLNRGRLSGGVWLADDGSGNALHPTKVLRGALINVAKQDYATATVVAAGGEMHDAGKWYSSILGGTTNGSTLLTDVGVTDWVEQGLYQRDYGVQQDGAATAIISPSNDLSGWPSLSTGTKVVNGDYTTINDTDATGFYQVRKISGAQTAGTLNWIEMALVKKTSFSGTNIVELKITNNGSWANNGTERSVQMQADGQYAIRLDGPTGAVDGSDYGVINWGDDWLLWVRTPGNGSAPFWGAQIFPSITNEATGLGTTDNTITGSVDVRYVNIKQEDVVSTPIKTLTGEVTRADALGSVKWASDFHNQSEFTVFSTACPQYGSADVAAANQVFLTLNNGLGLIYRSGATSFSVTDGTNTSSVNIGAWSRGDPLQFAVRASSSGNSLQISGRNGATGAAWVDGAATVYDDTIPDTGFMQLQKAGEANNLIWQQDPVEWRVLLTDAELTGVI